MVVVDHESVAEFIVETLDRLDWMDAELARLSDEGDRRALAAAKEELTVLLTTAEFRLLSGGEDPRWSSTIC